MSLDELVPPAASTAGGRRHGDPGGGRPERAPDLLRRPAQEGHAHPVRHHLVESGAEVQRPGNARLHGHHQQDDLAARERDMGGGGGAVCAERRVGGGVVVRFGR